MNELAKNKSAIFCKAVLVCPCEKSKRKRFFKTVKVELIYGHLQKKYFFTVKYLLRVIFFSNLGDASDFATFTFNHF